MDKPALLNCEKDAARSFAKDDHAAGDAVRKSSQTPSPFVDINGERENSSENSALHLSPEVRFKLDDSNKTDRSIHRK